MEKFGDDIIQSSIAEYDENGEFRLSKGSLENWPCRVAVYIWIVFFVFLICVGIYKMAMNVL